VGKFAPATHGHSNFVTPPDFIETILVLNATEEQIAACADVCYESGKIYNVYFYNKEMNNTDWFFQVQSIADYVLDATSCNPAEYFTK
jgi:hypothetical protein